VICSFCCASRPRGLARRWSSVTALLRRDAKGGFLVKWRGREASTRTVLLATGLVDENPVIEGLPSGIYSGAVRYCPICDGFEAMDRRIGVIGNAEQAAGKALFLRTYSTEVTMFELNRGAVPEETRQQLKDAGVAQAGGVTRVECTENGVIVTVEHGARIDLDVLYPALGCEVRSELATALGADCTEEGNLKVDIHQQTSVASLYAAGDVVSDLHQLAVATGHAAIATTAIHHRLSRNPR
jgi:thioredoxin reductase (NADPH)